VPGTVEDKTKAKNHLIYRPTSKFKYSQVYISYLFGQFDEGWRIGWL